MLIVPFVFADMVYFHSILASTEGASFSIPLSNFITCIRPGFTIEAVRSIPLSFPWVGIKMVGEEYRLGWVKVRIGTVCISLVFNGRHPGMAEAFAICCPGHPSVSAIVFLVDCSD